MILNPAKWFAEPAPAVKLPIKLVPSLAEQAASNGWEFDYFDFGKAQRDNVDFFNCGLVQRADGLWLVTRRAVWDKRDKFGVNDLMAFTLSKSLKPEFGFKVDLQQRWPIEHFEDPRAYCVDGRTFVSCCNFIRNKTGCTYPHQIICEVNDQWKLVKKWHPVYGENGKDTTLNTKHEKNWVWFWPDGKDREPHLLYSTEPFDVRPFNRDFKYPGIAVSVPEWGSTIWKYGIIRGGTPPVLIEGALWMTFFHSASPYNATKRQYHLGAYCFTAEAPFRITGITPEPLLSGSAFDGGLPNKPPCVFACGSVLQGKEWLITMGVNDMKCAYARIPHKDVLERMTAV